MSAAAEARERFKTVIHENFGAPSCKAIADKLTDETGEEVTGECVRKWLRNETKPSFDVLAALAEHKYGPRFIARIFNLPSPDERVEQWEDMLGQMVRELREGR